MNNTKKALTTRQPTRIVHVTLLNLCVECRHTLVIKWYLAADKDVQYDAKAPYIYLGSLVCPSLKQFRGGKVEAAAKRLEMSTGSKQITQAKVDDLDVTILIDENVLNLEVAVYDAVSVTIVERASNLAGKLAGLFLLELAMGDDVVEHLPAVDKLEQHVPMVVCAYNIFQATDVRVV